jgi:hypothetical protein
MALRQRFRQADNQSRNSYWTQKMEVKKRKDRRDTGRWCRKRIAFKCSFLSWAFDQRKQPGSNMMSLSPGNPQPLHQNTRIPSLQAKNASKKIFLHSMPLHN